MSTDQLPILCDQILEQVTHQWLNRFALAETPAEQQECELAFSILNMIAERVLGENILKTDRASGILCLFCYLLIKNAKSKQLQIIFKSISKPFNHLVIEVSDEKNKCYCDPLFFESSYGENEKKKHLKETAVNLIKIAEAEKKLSQEVETEIIQEDKQILKQYSNRLLSYGAFLKEEDDSELRKDIKKLSDKIRKKKRNKKKAYEKMERHIHKMQEVLLSDSIRIRKRFSILPKDQEAFITIFEGELSRSIKDMLWMDFFQSNDGAYI